jgi:hypothetical protein
VSENLAILGFQIGRRSNFSMKKSAVRHAISFSNLMVELLKGQTSGKVFAVKKIDEEVSTGVR